MPKRKIIQVVLATVLATLVTIGSTAAGVVDFTRNGSISVTLQTAAHSVVSGAKLELCRVAVLSDSAVPEYTLTEDFENCGISVDDIADSTAAKHLAAYAVAHSVQTVTAVTDSDGKAVFNDLPLGVYLVYQSGGGEKFYPIDPFVVTVPVTSASGTDWLYDVDASPKTQLRPTTAEVTTLTVKKLWQDGNTKNRPESVSVSLLRDGEQFDSVVLSDENDWQYTWAQLLADYSWSVTETNVPQGYTVKYVEEDGVVTIINTAENTPPDDYCTLTVKKLWNDGGSPDRPDSVTAELLRDSKPFDSVILSDKNGWQYTWSELDPDHTWGIREVDVPKGYAVSYAVNNSEVTITNTAKTLIQTGQSNLPIVILLAGGTTVFVVGWVVSTRRKKRNEK